MLKYKDENDARLARVTKVFSASFHSAFYIAKYHQNKECAQVVLIEVEYREIAFPLSKKDETDKSNTK